MRGTKQRIQEACSQLLEENIHGRITVQDVIRRCDINRNTFYYHYADMPDLLRQMAYLSFDEIFHQDARFDSPGDCLNVLAHYVERKKRSLLHLYHEADKDVFLESLGKACEYAVREYLKCSAQDLPADQEDGKLLVLFYKSAIMGVLLDWIADDCRYDLVAVSDRLSGLLDGGRRPPSRI